jgi:hypothetical protein
MRRIAAIRLEPAATMPRKALVTGIDFLPSLKGSRLVGNYRPQQPDVLTQINPVDRQTPQRNRVIPS